MTDRLILTLERNGTTYDNIFHLTAEEGARVEAACIERARRDGAEAADPDNPTLLEAVAYMARGTAAGILANVARTERETAAQAAAELVQDIELRPAD